MSPDLRLDGIGIILAAFVRLRVASSPELPESPILTAVRVLLGQQASPLKWESVLALFSW